LNWEDYVKCKTNNTFYCLQNKEKTEKNHDVKLKQSLNEIISHQYGGMSQ